MPHPKYRTADGKPVPSVTTIIGRFKDAGGLLWWAFEQGKSAERGEISSLYDKRDQAAEAGTLAHQMVEAHIGKTDPPNVMGYPAAIVAQAEQGFRNYLRWQADNRITIVEQEMELVSAEYRYGGRLDAVGLNSAGELLLLDWKTSNGVYPDYLIQIAAYAHLWHEAHPDEPLSGGYHLLRFSKNDADFSHHFWANLDDAWEQFLLFLRAYDLDKALKRRV